MRGRLDLLNNDGPDRRPVVLTLNNYYDPAYKGGGAIRSISNMVQQLSGKLFFRVVTSSTDIDNSRLDIERENEWIGVSEAAVYYISPDRISIGVLKRIFLTTYYDILYLNSFFDFRFTIIPLILRKFGFIPFKPCIVAPRGEFSAGALRLKYWKKRIFIELVRFVGLYNDVLWQASSALEEADIGNYFGKASIAIAPDLLSSQNNSARVETIFKQKESANLIFLSRISPKKNLAGALRALTAVRGKVQFDVFGPIEDVDYWNECMRIIQDLPNNIQVKYRGTILPEVVTETFTKYHAFLFPTFGENFGHVIAEALFAGCPVITSDQTPWSGLQGASAGWICPINSENAFALAIQSVVDIDNEEWQYIRNNSMRYIRIVGTDSNVLKQNEDLFLTALNKKRGG